MKEATAIDHHGESQRGRDSAPEHLIRLEGEIRRCSTNEELWDHLVNEPVTLLPFGQSLAFVQSGNQWRLEAASGLSEIQQDAPMVLWYQRLVARFCRDGLSSSTPLPKQEAEPQDKINSGPETREAPLSQVFTLPDYATPEDPIPQETGLPYLLWVPLIDGNTPVGVGWLLAREQPWEEHHRLLAQRLAATYAHSTNALIGRRKPTRRWRRKWPRILLSLIIATVTLASIPVPLVTMAPVEVAPQHPFVVAAPIDGVVDQILVLPGSTVSTGDPLIQLVDTSLRSDYQIAERRYEVARARTLRLRQASVSSSEARSELAIAQSEESVAAAERDYAQALLDKTLIRAEQDGVALYGNPRNWAGRPTSVGEAIMRIANPSLVEFHIKVPIADAINLRDQANVEIFLDARPLDPIAARITRAAYKAEADAAGIANFLTTARALPDQGSPPRLGLRGTARIHGDKVSLFYYLFRRPIVAIRQWTGI